MILWRRIVLCTVLGLAMTALSPPASAQTLSDFASVRGLGLGGAVRASASGDSGPTMNPSGMSLVRTYALEATYQHASPGPVQLGHASVVDSTSGYGIAGGLYYTYLNAKQKVAGTSTTVASGHELGLALSLPFGDRFFLGTTGRYVSLDHQEGTPDTKGLTMDVGVTLRPVSTVSLGLVGYNLRDIDSPRHPRAFGGGLSLGVAEGLLVEGDALFDLRSEEDARADVSFMGGLEYIAARMFVFRVAGGREGLGKRVHLNGGVGVVSEIGGVDVGFQRDVSGPTGVEKRTIFAVSGRLFVPSP